MSDVKKQWKGRGDLSISELEDTWFANRNLEMARSIILAVKDFQKISLEEKLEFLRSVFYEQNNLSHEGVAQYISSPLLETLLFLLPEWKQESVDNDGKPYAKLILVLLSYEYIYSHISVSAGQIKKFARSYLNSVKKEDMQEYLIVEVLINNRMFEEMVNYNFISDEMIEKLWDFLFKKDSRGVIYGDNTYYNLFRSSWCSAIPSRRERKKELLLSWDKVENRHALATLWTLLAKRGALQKIFGVEKAEEIKKAE